MKPYTTPKILREFLESLEVLKEAGGSSFFDERANQISPEFDEILRRNPFLMNLWLLSQKKITTFSFFRPFTFDSRNPAHGYPDLEDYTESRENPGNLSSFEVFKNNKLLKEYNRLAEIFPVSEGKLGGQAYMIFISKIRDLGEDNLEILEILEKIWTSDHELAEEFLLRNKEGTLTRFYQNNLRAGYEEREIVSALLKYTAGAEGEMGFLPAPKSFVDLTPGELVDTVEEKHKPDTRNPASFRFYSPDDRETYYVTLDKSPLDLGLWVATLSSIDNAEIARFVYEPGSRKIKQYSIRATQGKTFSVYDSERDYDDVTEQLTEDMLWFLKNNLRLQF